MLSIIEYYWVLLCFYFLLCFFFLINKLLRFFILNFLCYLSNFSIDKLLLTHTTTTYTGQCCNPVWSVEPVSELETGFCAFKCKVKKKIFKEVEQRNVILWSNQIYRSTDLPICVAWKGSGIPVMVNWNWRSFQIVCGFGSWDPDLMLGILKHTGILTWCNRKLKILL